MKYFVIFAGPNGSGKSSLRSSIEENHPLFLDFITSLKDVRNINADFFARTDSRVAKMPAGLEKDIMAWNVTEEARKESLEKGENIIWETVFSHESRLDDIYKAHNLGYYVLVIYVTTLNPGINIERVANRVKKGGHSVLPEKIVSRYERSTELLPKIVLAADEVLIYDNSSSHPVLVFFKVNNNKVYSSLIKNRKTEYYVIPRNEIGENRYRWITEHLIKTLKEHGCIIKSASNESE